MPGCRERGPCLWAMALLRTNVRSEASDGISMTVKEPNELSVAQDGIDRAPDLHAAMAAHRDPQEQLQDDEQAGGQASGRGSAAAARQRRTPRQRDGGQQRAVLRPPERPIGRAAITSSDLSGDIAHGGCVTARATLLAEPASCWSIWAPWGSTGLASGPRCCWPPCCTTCSSCPRPSSALSGPNTSSSSLF